MSSSRERRTAEPIPRAWAQRPIASGWSGCLWKWMNSSRACPMRSPNGRYGWLPSHPNIARVREPGSLLDNAICEPCTLGSPRMGCRGWAASNLMSRPPLSLIRSAISAMFGGGLRPPQPPAVRIDQSSELLAHRTDELL